MEHDGRRRQRLGLGFFFVVVKFDTLIPYYERNIIIIERVEVHIYIYIYIYIYIHTPQLSQ